MRYVSAHPGLRIMRLARLSRRDTWFDLGETVLVRRCHWARDALWLLAHQLVDQGRSVALPSYLCHSVLEPFQDAGAAFKFYKVTRGLEPDIADLRRLLKSGVGAVLLIHYNGVPQRRAADIAKLCSESDAMLIEDCSEYVGSVTLGDTTGQLGHASVFNFRKFLPVPDYALLAIRDRRLSYGLASPKCIASLSLLSVFDLTMKGLRVSTRPMNPRVLGKLHQHVLARQREARLTYRYTSCAPSPFSRSIVQLTDSVQVRNRRRANCDLLYQEISACPQVVTYPMDLAHGVVPRGVAVLLDRRDEVKTALADLGIESSIRWPLPSEVSREDFPDAHWVADRILVLPCHQDLAAHHIKYLVGAFSDAVSLLED